MRVFLVRGVDSTRHQLTKSEILHKGLKVRRFIDGDSPGRGIKE